MPHTAVQNTILVVDDEAAIREIVAEGLTLAGYQVIKAASGEDALLLARGRRDLRLVVSDVQLPGMSGVELAEHLINLDPPLPTILMSGYFSPQPIARKLLQKPFSIGELEAAVASELAR